MKNKDLLHAINDIDSRYIQDAGEQKPKLARKRLLAAGLAAASVAFLVGIWGWRYGKDEAVDCGSPNGVIIAQAQYPECAVYPREEEYDANPSEEAREEYKAMARRWREERDARIRASEGCREELYPFYETTMRELLVRDENTNRTYSPLNLYMALSMLAELTDGNSRAQILGLLSAPDIDTVRERATSLWTANYSDDGLVTSILANSLWLRKGVDFIPETMQTLAGTYHASAFQGEMGSQEFTKMFHTWINEQTGGLLKEQIEGIKMNPRTVLGLVSTIYYRAQWEDRFYEKNTKEDIFHKADGDVVCDFMNQGKMDYCYYGENFSAVRCGLERSGSMWLFLPDEAADVNAVIGSGEILRLIRGSGAWENKVYADINLAMPKFDVVSEIDLVDGLKAMGITDVFDADVADFSPMKKNADDVWLSEAKHASRVAVDEKGCVAVAYTSMMLFDGAAPLSPEKVDFVLDRPFLFAITGADGAILFIGVVEEP